jgi:hypothetical protein
MPLFDGVVFVGDIADEFPMRSSIVTMPAVPPYSSTTIAMWLALAEGKAVRDIKKCLKRSIARQLFRQLELVPRPLDGI